ncbi:uncharacterized protein [Aegilops tauschii subsp. strangulata]|uniref:uncharacterized protein n=1 Tax=Aegilops tauschii subsp. strangulata TaxID=200361 RepID=UPI003CC87233
MDGGNKLNLIYTDTVRKMGTDPPWIKPNNTSFKGIIPAIKAQCSGTITLEVVFGSPNNFRSEDLIFDNVPFHIGYHALAGHTTFARFNVVPHYAYLKIKMSGPKGVITVSGNTECSIRTEEQTAALAAEVQAAEEAPRSVKATNTQSSVKCLRGVSFASM